MDAQKLSRLKYEQERAVLETDDRIRQWEKFQSDYVALKNRLKTLPDKITHDVMVPFGSMAFMPGKLVHTNEILVLLGDNWFVERSAKQAASIVTRRLKAVKTELSELKEQRKLLEPRINFTTDLQQTAQEQGLIDITEEFDEEKEKKWKEQHRKNVQKHRKTLRDQEKSNRKPDTGQEMSDQELWARLDELERIERKRKELHRLTDNEVPITWGHKESSEEDEEDTEEEDQLSSAEESDEAPNMEEDDSCSETEGMSINTKFITFSHSTTSNEETQLSETDVIESPQDIYRKFCTSNEPKSILKTNNGGTKKVKKRVKMKEDIVEDSRKRMAKQQQSAACPMAVEYVHPLLHFLLKKERGVLAFSGTVLEKQTQETVPNISPVIFKETKSIPDSTVDSQPKRVSKFKAERQKKMSSSQ